MAMTWRQGFVTLSSIIMLPAAGCAAEKTHNYIDRDVITLSPLDGADAETRARSWDKMLTMFRERAAEEAGDADFRPQVGSWISPALQHDAQPFTVIVAVTPRKGVFYLLPLVRYPRSDRNADAGDDKQNGKVQGCRMEIRWNELPDGIMQGLGWSGRYLSGLDCMPPSAKALADADRQASMKADSVLEGKTSDGKLSVMLVREIDSYRIFDPVSASALILEPDDGVISAFPLAGGEPAAAVLNTRSGRKLTYIEPRGAGMSGDLMCSVEGLQWPDIVNDHAVPSAMRTARQLCNSLVKEYDARRRAKLRSMYEAGDMPTLHVVPPPPRLPDTKSGSSKKNDHPAVQERN